MDWDEIRRNKALREFNKDPQEAILKGLVDEAGNPLDDREFTYKFGEKVDNPNYRKPLVGNSCERKIIGIVNMEDDDKPKILRLNFKGKNTHFSVAT